MRTLTLPAVSTATLTLLGLVACTGGGDSNATDDVEPSLDACDALEGENVVLTVPFSPGGGYDSYARMIAPTFGDTIGANVSVENRDGAGGLLAMNNLLGADTDGTDIAIMNGVGTGGAALAQAEGVNFSVDDLTYIGRVAAEVDVVVTRSDGEFETWEDIESASDFRFGSTGPGAADYVNPTVLTSIFDLDASIISGFAGSSELEVAALQGDVDGTTGTLDSRISALESGEQEALLTIGPERPDSLPDTPTIGELDLDDTQRAQVEAHQQLFDLGRSIVGPPDMDAEALACLRAGLEETLADPDMIETAEQTGLPLGYLSGEELEETANELENAPDEYLETLREAFN